MASRTAASVEEKLAQLGLDKMPSAPSNSKESAGSSSVDSAAAGAPPLPVHQPEDEQICFSERLPVHQPKDEQICCICFDGAELPSRPLVQPCACRGSSIWAHADCLTEWRRSTSAKADAAYRFGQCHDDYRDALSLELLEERLRQQRAAHGPGTLSTMNASWHGNCTPRATHLTRASPA